MKKIIPFCFILITATQISCVNIFHETIHGDGNIKSEQRDITEVSHIESYGNFDIEITQGSPVSVRIDADENLLPYIVTKNENGTLEIRTKDKVNLSSDNKIKVYVTTDKLEEASVIGSGNITGTNTIVGGDDLKLDITGSGNITLAVNTPSVKSSIEGTGDINLSGDAKESKIEIDGLGNYKAEDLSAADVDITIAGSGNARVSAKDNLSIDIAGSGDVYYHGTPAIHQSIAGTGTIKQVQ